MKIKIITVNGYFGQRLPTSKSIDVSLLVSLMHGYGFESEIVDIQDVQNALVNEEARYIVGSHQNTNIKKYINDVLTIKFEGYKDCLVPSLRNVLAHENKGIQALIMKEFPEIFVQQDYFYRDEGINVTAPKVLKRTYGAGSFGVALINNDEDYICKKRKMFLGDTTFNDIKFIISEWAKKTIFRSRLSKEHTLYFKKYNPFVLQEFIPNLTGDYKVLVFGSKYYLLRRQVRDNDFRASGSGKFMFEEANGKLLSFAMRVKEVLNTPYASLDIIERENGYGCIEFQCLHFGPYTQLNAEYYYELKGGEWVKYKNEYSLEQVYAESLAEFLKNE